MSKSITVFGATGNQGGSVITAILADPVLSKEFIIRGITRDATKAAAVELAKRGVDVRSADMTSKESVSKAIKGSHTVFLVTTPVWGQDPEAELIAGRVVADAAKAEGIQHIIFSSLLSVTEVSGGRLRNVHHFDMKAKVEQHIRSTGVPSTFVLPGYFMSNFASFSMIRKGDDGIYTLAYPVSETAGFPLIDVSTDIGKYVVAAMRNREQVLGSRIEAAVDYYTPLQILSSFEKATGTKAKYVQVDSETYKGFLPAPLAQELLENHLFIENPGYYAGRSLTESKNLLASVGLKATTLEEYFEKNKAAFVR